MSVQITAASLNDLLSRMGFAVESTEELENGGILVLLARSDKRGASQPYRVERILSNLGIPVTKVPAGILVSSR